MRQGTKCYEFFCGKPDRPVIVPDGCPVGIGKDSGESGGEMEETASAMGDSNATGGLRIAVLVSGQGRGSNMQALIDGCRSGQISGSVALVIGTRSDAPAIERAKSAGV